MVMLSIHDDPPADAARIVDAGLGDANSSAAPLHEVRPLAAFARDDAGAVIGGAIGRTWGACAELQQLWVHEAWRRRGIGAQLVRRYEERARERGCRLFYLETWSFQAPRLYRALGYEVEHEIGGHAPGIVKYLMVRVEEGAAR